MKMSQVTEKKHKCQSMSEHLRPLRASSSTPDATNEALDELHQVCLRQHLFCGCVLLWGILFRGLNLKLNLGKQL